MFDCFVREVHMGKLSFLGRLLRPVAIAGAMILACGAASAQVKLEISVPWGPNEFHSLDAAAFAKRVTEETHGQVQMVARPGGELGVKANESVRAVAEGVVPMADLALFQNASRGPALAAETLPFLVSDYDQLKVLHKYFRPLWEKILERNNQKVLYLVPWPKQFFFVKKPVAHIDAAKMMGRWYEVARFPNMIQRGCQAGMSEWNRVPDGFAVIQTCHKGSPNGPVTEWKGNLFVSGMIAQSLVRLVLDGDKVVGEERLLTDLKQRIRDVRQGPDGLIYVVTDRANGKIYKLVPKG